MFCLDSFLRLRFLHLHFFFSNDNFSERIKKTWEKLHNEITKYTIIIQLNPILASSDENFNEHNVSTLRRTRIIVIKKKDNSF